MENKTTTAQLKASNKYNKSHNKSVTVNLPANLVDSFTAACKVLEVSKYSLIKQLILDTIAQAGIGTDEK